MTKESARSGMWVFWLIGCALFVLFAALAFAPTASEMMHGKTLEQRWAEIAMEEEFSRKSEAEACLASKTPWRCLVEMSGLDREDLSILGSSKRSRAAFVTASTDASVALIFCREEGLANCGERLVDLGYSSDVVVSALSKVRG